MGLKSVKPDLSENIFGNLHGIEKLIFHIYLTSFNQIKV